MQTFVANRLHQGTTRLRIGGLPVRYSDSDAVAEEVINANIRQFITSGLTLKYAPVTAYKAISHISITEDNEYSEKVVTVNMIADDRMANWWTLNRYMMTIQSGQTEGFPILDTRHRVYGPGGNHYRNRATWIPTIDIIFADDSMQKWQTVRHMRCFPLVLGDITSTFDSPEPVTFDFSFLYDIRTVIREKEPMDESPPPCVLQG
jgi:hypothetical protein